LQLVLAAIRLSDENGSVIWVVDIIKRAVFVSPETGEPKDMGNTC